MKITDITWKLDVIAGASFVDPDSRKAVTDSAYALRELFVTFGLGSEATVSELLADVNKLIQENRELKEQAEQ